MHDADERSARLEARASDALALLRDASPAPYGALVTQLVDGVFARLAEARGASRRVFEGALHDAVALLTAPDLVDAEHLGAVYEALLDADPSGARRRAGAHYTPRALTAEVLRATLAPLLADATPEQVLALRVCDPAMGGGAFLVEACRQLGDALAVAWVTHARPEASWPDAMRRDAARKLVAQRCLYGVDRDAMAVSVARRALWLVAAAPDEAPGFVDAQLCVGDALVGRGWRDGSRYEPSAREGFDWPTAFPAVRDEGGFSAMVGNPPWVSYVGRAAQPLDATLRRHYDATYDAFAAYKNLQGLFIERAASLLRAGGRLGLVVPSSMAELKGYGPTRAAHDRYAVCDPTLPDHGEDSFRGVFQPCMVLRSTARATVKTSGDDAPWPLERPDLDDEARAILARMDGPRLPPELFGERGVQTRSDDLAHLRPTRDETHTVGLRAGGDIRAFQRGSVSLWADARWFGARLRSPEAWAKVDVVIRQTARVPIAARSDGEGFRNSLLAGFGSAAFPAGFLVAYLNATMVRWQHYHRHRDARLGMPQVKIGHLRAIPAPPSGLVATLTAMGDALSAHNRGITETEQRRLDDAVMDAFELNETERARVRRDAAKWR